MARFSFVGIHPKSGKELSMHQEIKSAFQPKMVKIPLRQHIGGQAVACVKEGDIVKKGMLIGKAAEGISANVYSSVSGVCKGIEQLVDIQGNKCEHIVIENDFKEEEQKLPALKNIDRDSVIARINLAGIVGLGGATFPSAKKVGANVSLDTLIINGAECEPYLTCDYRIMLEYTAEVIKGIKLLKLASGVDRVFFGIEEDKIDAIKKFDENAEVEIVNSKGFDKKPNAPIKICILKAKYPQGSEKHLIYTVTKKVVGEGDLPSSVGVVVYNIQTALATYFAVEENKPLYERVVTLSGEGFQNPCNAWVKTGTSVKELAENFGGDFATSKVVCGGTMTGKILNTFDVYTTKGCGAILFLLDSESPKFRQTPCIGCGKCVNTCPMHLMPVYIDEYTLLGEYKEAKSYGALACIECGSCGYVCPAKKPLVESIRLAKKMIREKKI